MSDNPTPLPTTDTTASSADATVQKIVGLAEAPVEEAIITAEPWMGVVIFKQLWEGVLDWIFGLLKFDLGTLTGFVVIDVQKYLALTNAASALAALKSAQVTGDADAIAKANANVDAAVAPILHYVGSLKL